VRSGLNAPGPGHELRRRVVTSVHKDYHYSQLQSAAQV
jgi:hypothetical protein